MNDASARRTYAALRRRTGEPQLEQHLSEAQLVHLPANVPPWTASGVYVRRGEWLTLISSGRLVLAEELDLWYGPTFALWARVGPTGRIFKGTRDTFSFVAAADGRTWRGDAVTTAGTTAELHLE